MREEEAEEERRRRGGEEEEEELLPVGPHDTLLVTIQFPPQPKLVSFIGKIRVDFYSRWRHDIMLKITHNILVRLL